MLQLQKCSLLLSFSTELSQLILVTEYQTEIFHLLLRNLVEAVTGAKLKQSSQGEHFLISLISETVERLLLK